MKDINFFSSLDGHDSQVLSPSSEYCVYGWVFASNAEVEEVYVEYGDRGRFRASFPLPRPDVKYYYPDFDQAENSGFISAPIKLNAGCNHALEVKVIVKCEGAEYMVLTKKINIIWSDPARELFRLGAIGPFRFPEIFDATRLSRYGDCAPVFLVGGEQAVERALQSLESRGCVLPKADLFLELLNILVECHDVYSEFWNGRFKQLESNINSYAISKFDIYGVLNGLIAIFHAYAVSGVNTPGFVYALAGKKHVVLIPLLRLIYPNANFVYLRPMAGELEPVQSSGASGNDERFDEARSGRSFGEIWRILKEGGAPFNVREIESHDLDGNPGAADDLLSLPWFSAVTNRGKASVPSNDLQKVVSMVDDDYIQAVPSFVEHRPIFVLGAGRSGTSAMTGALMAAGIAGFNEGHVFPLINEMAKRLWKAKSYLPGGVGRDQIVTVAVKTAFEQVYGDLSGREWLDKTPDHLMIDCVPLVRAMLPQARFVYMRRHPISYAESRQRKFGETPLVAINEWNKCINRWDAQKSSLPDYSYMECDVRSLKDSVRQRELCGFLKLDEAKCKEFSNYLSSQRPELTRMPKNLNVLLEGLDDARKFKVRSILFSLLDGMGEYVEDTDWDAETIRVVLESLGSMPEKLGYAIHRPKNYLPEVLFPLAKQIEEYRFAAEKWKEAAEARWITKIAKKIRNLLSTGDLK